MSKIWNVLHSTNRKTHENWCSFSLWLVYHKDKVNFIVKAFCGQHWAKYDTLLALYQGHYPEKCRFYLVFSSEDMREAMSRPLFSFPPGIYRCSYRGWSAVEFCANPTVSANWLETPKRILWMILSNVLIHLDTYNPRVSPEWQFP